MHKALLTVDASGGRTLPAVTSSESVLLSLGYTRRPSSLAHEMRWLQPKKHNKSSHHRRAKCSFVATIFAIWIERNTRIFSDTTRTVDSLLAHIQSIANIRMSQFE